MGDGPLEEIHQRRRQESNLLDSRVAADRLTVRPRRHENESRRWGSNPLGPRYEGGARPVEHRRPLSAASAGVEPARPGFKAPAPSEGPADGEGGRRESNPHFPGSRPGLAAALSSATVLQPGMNQELGLRTAV
jgi:hypothetical protein